MVRVSGFEEPSLSPPNYHDIREDVMERLETDKKLAKKVGAFPRSWKKVTGICMHQTASELGERPGRYETLGAHVAVTRTGKIVHVYDFNIRVYHGNRWNGGTVGIEVDGSYHGVEGKRKSWWPGGSVHSPQQLTDASVEATQQAIRWICKQVERNGSKIKVIVAHRQSSKSRRSDPGSAIWQRIVMPMQKELELSDGNKAADSKFAIGGYPIPEDWNPKYVGVKY